ncbi:MAG: hypothetical protein R2827_04335 [Bdellovibrionales bacterium]
MRGKTIFVVSLAVLMSALSLSHAEEAERGLRGPGPGNFIGSPDRGFDLPQFDRGRRDRGYQQQRIRIQVDQMYNGHHTLPLKAMIRRQTGINLQDMDLTQVVVFAKSARGHGQAILNIGGQVQDQVTIAGSRGDFFSDRPATFSTHQMFARNSREGRGGQVGSGRNEIWQMDLRGRIKVKNIIAFIQPKAIHDDPLRLVLPMNTIIRGEQTIGLKRDSRKSPKLKFERFRFGSSELES